MKHIFFLLRVLGQIFLPMLLIAIPAIATGLLTAWIIDAATARLVMYGVGLGLMILLTVYALRVGMPPMSTNPVMEAALLQTLHDVNEGTIYELGSGFGGLARALAQAKPHAIVQAIELSPVPFSWSWVVQKIFPLPNLVIQRADALQIPLHNASAVVVFLYPGMLRQLGEKMRRELPPTAKIISHEFPFPDWVSSESITVPGFAGGKIFCYRAAENRAA